MSVKKFALLASITAVLTGCASSPPIQPASTSRSAFDGAVYSGESVSLGSPTPGAEQFRAFQQGATGFVSVDSVRSAVYEMATGFCGRRHKQMRELVETASKGPHVLGNFPRVELVFECVDQPKTAAPTPAPDKYDRLAALKKLLDGGALTQAEYESEKAKILAQP